MKKLSIFLLMFVVVLISCKKTPPVNIQYVDVEREVLNIGSTTANIQCDYEYIATLKSAKLYYGRTEDNMNSVTMRVVQSALYAEISGLSANTTYKYYYEFENGFNSMKSGVKAFTTLDDGGGGSGDVPIGAIDGPFTVNENGDKVYFSQGNLQYQASTNIWKFAENQWNQVGGRFHVGEIGNVYENGVKCDNMLVSATYSGWIDMFCWGTSGWDCGNTYYMPYDKDGEGEQYGPLGYSTLTGEFANSDWGVYNAIANGGNQPGLWRTLSDGEWQFIMRHRTNAEQKYSLAVVNGVHGCILLPDEWVCPTGLSFVPQSFDWTTNVYSEAQWTLMELNGAVFLPASGFRNPSALLNYDCCIYQTVNSGTDFGNISFFINTEAYVPSPGHTRVLARSVRLVQDANPQPSVTTPTVITSNVSNITSNSAICGGEVTNDGGAEETERGICWSTNTNPTINNSHVAEGTGTGEFTAEMYGLDANTTYHVRAYATNEAGTAYGLDKTFTTLSGGGGPTHDDYFTIESLEDNNTITLYIPSSIDSQCLTSVSYSTDGATWTNINIDATDQTISVTLNQGETVHYKGLGLQYAKNWEVDMQSYFNTSGNINVSGNIMSLLYGDDFANITEFPSGSSNTFQGLFQYADKLVSAGNLVLPATALKYECYRAMFLGCTLLADAPILPATVLAYGCYNKMFMYCNSLIEAPELPATTLAGFCYDCMFLECTSLTVAPVLPATTMMGECYRCMFLGCTSLTDAPALPATTLATQCYEDMFRRCTSLTKAPDLPATILAPGCYFGMFESCAITEAPALPATTLAYACYTNMFKLCSSLTEAPLLPAISLAESCYYSMFEGCTSLTRTPVLSATTLKDHCYCCMFGGCTSLVEVTCLATNILADGCTSSWLNRVPSIGTFYKNSAMNDWQLNSNSGIPNGWNVVDY